MNVVISCADNTVIVDGVSLWVDCKDVHGLISVIRWDGAQGHLEFYNDGKGRFIPNMPITDFAPYTFLVDKWNEAKAENDAKAKANEAARADGPAALEHVRGVAAAKKPA